ncbi:MAG: acetyl-CoA carboxylase carboxyltransferase subunit beta [Candidatus Omnitrophica bacterium]|nr:acetyl-CoA carboxylase carboxyltransferase subunit beta [Candidatus Omnitrophota bacterium]
MVKFAKTFKSFPQQRKKDIPGGLWIKCKKCGEVLYKKSWEESFRVCTKCQYHYPLPSADRIALIADPGSFREIDADLQSCDPLEFEGPKTYKAKLKEDQKATGLKDAVVTGEAQLDGMDIVLGVTDSRFMMGSMGSVVGEKLTRAIERATQRSVPVLLVSGSGGGARMQEGMLSLMQMAKTSAALARHAKAGQLYISILTDPTMAGVLASFASLGDIIIAEPGALIGFTGPRVIEQTIRQKLPEGFQRSEFLLDHGLIDKIVPRAEIKPTLSQVVGQLCG